ncbi:MAG TPA: RNA methyltransferase [Candidatus Binatia bacterium]|nr:RNA methyltransferase [Candidatus Binatia bacterium]
MFQMRQCQNEACRFRFPVTADTQHGWQCPECGARTVFVSESFAASHPNVVVEDEGPPVEALLDNIRSVFNVGAMFRTADGAGLRRLHLCGITATPEHPKVAKTALGAECTTPWSRYTNALDAAQLLQSQGAQLWALERQTGSESLFAANPSAAKAPIVLVVGNELAGVDPQLLQRCDRILHIPMAGVKESLNVAIAFGVAAYYLRHARRE